MVSPTQRSLKYLRNHNWHCEVVERFSPFTRVRQDLLGFADLLCLQRGLTPLLVQVTSAGWAARVRKINNEPRACLALASGFQIEVHGWRKLKSNKNRWTIKIIKITEVDAHYVF